MLPEDILREWRAKFRTAQLASLCIAFIAGKTHLTILPINLSRDKIQRGASRKRNQSVATFTIERIQQHEAFISGFIPAPAWAAVLRCTAKVSKQWHVHPLNSYTWLKRKAPQWAQRWGPCSEKRDQAPLQETGCVQIFLIFNFNQGAENLGL